MAGNCEFLTRNPINIFSWNLPCNVVYLPWIETFQFRGKSFHTAQKMRFSIKDFFSKCEEIRRKLRIWSHLLKKSLIENLIFCAVSCSRLANNENSMNQRIIWTRKGLPYSPFSYLTYSATEFNRFNRFKVP